jgi:hypothetical protein
MSSFNIIDNPADNEFNIIPMDNHTEINLNNQIKKDTSIDEDFEGQINHEHSYQCNNDVDIEKNKTNEKSAIDLDDINCVEKNKFEMNIVKDINVCVKDTQPRLAISHKLSNIIF